MVFITWTSNKYFMSFEDTGNSRLTKQQYFITAHYSPVRQMRK